MREQPGIVGLWKIHYTSLNCPVVYVFASYGHIVRYFLILLLSGLVFVAIPFSVICIEK